MSTETTPISLRTRLTAGAIDAAIAGGLALFLTFAHGYNSQRYISYDSSGISTGTTTHQSFSVPVFIVLSVLFWFALAFLASRDSYSRTPGQRKAGYRPRPTSGETRLDIPALLWRQAFRAAAAPSAIIALVQGRELQPSHDALSKTSVERCSRERKGPTRSGPVPPMSTRPAPPTRTGPIPTLRREPPSGVRIDAATQAAAAPKGRFKPRPIKKLDLEILTAWGVLSAIDNLSPAHQEQALATAQSEIRQSAVAAATAGHLALARDALRVAGGRLPDSSAADRWPEIIDQALAALEPSA